MPDPAKVDAILLPKGYASLKNPRDPSKVIRNEFQAMLGGGPIEVRDVGVGSFVAPVAAPHNTFLFHTQHELAGQPRYTWVDRGDGVGYGTLVPDPETPEQRIEAQTNLHIDLKAYFAAEADRKRERDAVIDLSRKQAGLAAPADGTEPIPGSGNAGI